MENFGSEIGQKMRSAVKAKLLELGTGGSAGYIDDELPDYVMIMVANKRSKQQMITDLNLFLGTQTQLFVTWLHEVLQKLQEVTLPAAAVNVTATTKKRKSGQREELAAAASSSSSSKKDKKTHKKEKKLNSKKSVVAEVAQSGAVEEPEAPTTTTGAFPVAVPVINSITDVFAEDLLEKAKKTMAQTADASLSIKKGKEKKSTQKKKVSAHDEKEAEKDTPQQAKTTSTFDIPTISEISSTTGGANLSGNREQDLAELAEIQKKIYAAKKHLKQLEQIEAESEDEDFLNLKDDGSADEFDEAGDLVTKKSNKPKSPIIFNNDEIERRRADSPEEGTAPAAAADDQQQLHNNNNKHCSLTPPLVSATVSAASVFNRGRRESSTAKLKTDDDLRPVRHSRERERRQPTAPTTAKKRSVHERLGFKAAQRDEDNRERQRGRGRQSKELYVPAFRRREMAGSAHERERERSAKETIEQRLRERERDRVDREREHHQRAATPNEQQQQQQPTSSSALGRARKRAQLSTPNARYRSRVSSNEGRVERSVSPPTQRQRIGSRVIVATNKPPVPSDDEDLANKPVNSVITIKPRPHMSPSKQACKNLLLRAVAEAQRSTVLCVPKPPVETTSSPTKVTVHLGDGGDRATKLYTKSYRDRLKRNHAGSANLLRRTAKNFVVEVEAKGVEDAGASVGSDAGLESALFRKRCRRDDTLSVEQELHGEAEEYVPEAYVQKILLSGNEENLQIKCHLNEEDFEVILPQCDQFDTEKTQFVVTLNDDKTLAQKTRRANLATRSRSNSPLPQVTSSSSLGRNDVEAHSSSGTSNRGKHLSKKRPAPRRRTDAAQTRPQSKANSPHLNSSPNVVGSAQKAERDAGNVSGTCNTPPSAQRRRREIVDGQRESKQLKRSNNSDEESGKRAHKRRRSAETTIEQLNEERSTTPPLPNAVRGRSTSGGGDTTEKTPKASPSPSFAAKRKHLPIKFDLNAGKEEEEEEEEHVKRGAADGVQRPSNSCERKISKNERDIDGDEFHQSKQRISIRNTEAKKYENIPSLSSLTSESSALRVNKPKERCKYHPNCTKHNCDYYHPTAPCKSFPNCKFAEKCLYSHPRCKFDVACVNMDCNFSHSGPRNPTLLHAVAPPLSSHVVPVQNYKSISAAPAASSAMCKYYPNCTKIGCTFYHPKPCRFGKNCINKLECNFYHHELQSSSKFKWVATVV